MNDNLSVFIGSVEIQICPNLDTIMNILGSSFILYVLRLHVSAGTGF